jgi:hypothetical protein|tara:strand:+ start:14719 stop:15162 length:444 start_codon:yes stop_codon:yes gene_type:complete
LLKESLNKWLKIDPISIIRQILSDRAILNWIEEANRKQLLTGKNSFDVKLSDIGGGYSDLTLQLNPNKQRDVVNLLDTSEFYASITATVDSSLLEIDADPIKTDDNGKDTNLYDRWGEDIIGLNEENLQELIDTLKDKLIIEILKKT